MDQKCNWSRQASAFAGIYINARRLSPLPPRDRRRKYRVVLKSSLSERLEAAGRLQGWRVRTSGRGLVKVDSHVVVFGERCRNEEVSRPLDVMRGHLVYYPKLLNRERKFTVSGGGGGK